MAGIIKRENIRQNSPTAFCNTTNLLRKGLNTYDLPPINANQGKVNLSNISTVEEPK